MSLPGVESARRRRVSHHHGRSSVGFVQPPPLRRRSIPHPSASSFLPRPAEHRGLQEPADPILEQILDERAIAARHRLDARLRAPAIITSRHDMASLARSLKLPSARPAHGAVRVVMLEQTAGSGAHQQGDCPVCLDNLVGGQRVINLPCLHTFHSKCIVPWLQSHSHCPSCRAKVSPHP